MDHTEAYKTYLDLLAPLAKISLLWHFEWIKKEENHQAYSGIEGTSIEFYLPLNTSSNQLSLDSAFDLMSTTRLVSEFLSDGTHIKINPALLWKQGILRSFRYSLESMFNIFDIVIDNQDDKDLLGVKIPITRRYASLRGFEIQRIDRNFDTNYENNLVNLMQDKECYDLIISPLLEHLRLSATEGINLGGFGINYDNMSPAGTVIDALVAGYHTALRLNVAISLDIGSELNDKMIIKSSGLSKESLPLCDRGIVEGNPHLSINDVYSTTRSGQITFGHHNLQRNQYGGCTINHPNTNQQDKIFDKYGISLSGTQFNGLFVEYYKQIYLRIFEPQVHELFENIENYENVHLVNGFQERMVRQGEVVRLIKNECPFH